MSAGQDRLDQGARVGAKRPPLGNNAGSSSPPPESTLQTPRFTESERRLRRVERYRVQSIIRAAIGRAGHAQGLEFPFQYHKTAKCRHVRRGPEVEILKSKKHGTCHYGGLVVCGNARTCPVCAPIIQERRAAEVRKFFQWAYDSDRRGGKVVMITFTFPHTRDMSFKECRAKMAKAFTRLRSGKRYQRLKARIGMHTGFIKATEVTYGDNGWHLHTHELWPVDKGADAEWLQAELVELWERACRAADLLPAGKLEAFRRHSVDLVDNAKESEYIAKQGSEEDFAWGADREVVKASTKAGRGKGKTPFQLAAGDDHELALFMEFLDGARRLDTPYWSNGLKATVGVDEVDDETLAEQHDDAASCLALLTPHDWSLIIAAEAKAEILTIAETRGIAGVRRWLDAIERGLLGDQATIAIAAGESQPGRSGAFWTGHDNAHVRPLAPDPLALVSDWRCRPEPEPGLDSLPAPGSGPGPG